MEPEGSLPVRKNPPLVRILTHINPLHTTPSYLRFILMLSTHLRLGGNCRERTCPMQTSYIPCTKSHAIFLSIGRLSKEST
jgi:hypothetical protein